LFLPLFLQVFLLARSAAASSVDCFPGGRFKVPNVSARRAGFKAQAQIEVTYHPSLLLSMMKVRHRCVPNFFVDACRSRFIATTS